MVSHSSSHRWARAGKGHTGQALVEFALVFPILIVLIVAFLDFGYLLFVQNTLSHAAREGLRLAETNQASRTEIIQAIVGHAVGVNLNPGHITLRTQKQDAGFPTRPPTVTISLDYPHQFFVPWWHQGLFHVRLELKGVVSTQPNRRKIAF